MDATAQGTSTQPVQLSQNALAVLYERYLEKDEKGQYLEDPEGMFRRVAKAVASAEETEDARKEYEEKFFNLMASGRFIPNSPTLMNAGRRLGMLSACFVLPMPDDTTGIFDTLKHTALIQKAGGGTGFALDELRPCGSFIGSSGGTSSGPLSFWRAYCEGTHSIQQGSFRRGANMAMMSVDHPDIIKFIFAKQDLSQFTNYNISVKVSDNFVWAAQKLSASPYHVVRWRDKNWLIPKKVVERCRKVVEDGIKHKSEPRLLDTCYGVGDLIEVTSAVREDLGSKHNCLRASELMDMIVDHAWKTGEPGLCFIDRIRETEPTPHVAKIQSTNPCGEQPLMPYGSCNLGSINLSKFIRQLPVLDGEEIDYSAPEADEAVDWPALTDTVQLAVRFLDNIVSINRFPIEEITRTAQDNRNIGLGVMGFHDALLQLGVKYDSENGLGWAYAFMSAVKDNAISASGDLAVEKGKFKNWKDSIWDENHHTEVRNCCLTTVAPTGTISIIADCSSGIEPWFSYRFKRQVLGGKVLPQTVPILKQVAELHGFDNDKLWDTLLEKGSLQDIPGLPEWVKHVFVTAQDISWDWHVKMQAAFQENTTSAVSKTINMSSGATRDNVKDAYFLAHKSKCKGITVYRNGSRANQPMALEDNNGNGHAHPAMLPDTLLSIKVRRKTQLGTLHVHVSVDDKNRPCEVFAQLGKGGDMVIADIEAMCRAASLYLRVGGDLRDIIHQWQGINTGQMTATNQGIASGTSIPNELAIALASVVANLSGTAPKAKAPNPSDNGGRQRSAILRSLHRQLTNGGDKRSKCSTKGCPGLVVREGNCDLCYLCGASICG